MAPNPVDELDARGEGGESGAARTASGVEIADTKQQNRQPARTEAPQTRSILGKAVLPSKIAVIEESLADIRGEGYLVGARSGLYLL
jgi:hypothetical protein